MLIKNGKLSRVKYVLTIASAWSLAAGASVVSMMAGAASNDVPPDQATSSAPGHAVVATPKIHLDRSGHKQFGKASFYASHYAGKTMADGSPMQLYSNNAASTTLPLGSTARVTNLETGKSAVVTIRDRGPYVKGRIVDLSPATARRIGLDARKGVVKVEVAPLTIPMMDGTVKIARDALASN